MDYYPVQDYRPATIECVLDSAVRRNVPANFMLAIAQIEGGKEGTVSPNTNGTADFGKWQINSIHLKELANYGVPPATARYYLTWDGCYSADYAAYRLQRCLAEPAAGRDIYHRAACYHSKTPKFNDIYAKKLKPLSIKWANWLSSHYQVKEIHP